MKPAFMGYRRSKRMSESLGQSSPVKPLPNKLKRRKSEHEWYDSVVMTHLDCRETLQDPACR